MTSENLAAAPRRWLPACVGVVAALQILVVNHWPAFPSPNERSRAYQAIAIASRGDLAIDAEVARFGAMEDVAGVGGRLYPNKAPGATLLVVPAALVAHVIAGGTPDELALTLTLGRLLASSLPFVLTLLLLAGHLRDRAPAGAAMAVAGLGLASPALTASLLLFSHALAGFLLLAAFVLLYSRPLPTAWREGLAGLAIGWAVTAEYPVAVPAAVLLVLALPRLRITGTLAVAAGGAVPALALAAYNSACFGSPFSLSSGHEASAAYAGLASHGLFGVGLPALSGLAGLLISPERGLLVWFPLAALAAAGLARRPGATGCERAAAALAPLSLLVAIAGYPNWHGGWFPGPRYLLATLPILCILVAHGAAATASSRPFRLVAAAALLWGAVQTWLSIASFPFPPDDYPLPATTFSLPLLRAGVLVPTWLPRSVAAIALSALCAGTLVLLLHIALPTASRRDRAFALALAAALSAATLAVSAPGTWRARIEYAVVHDIYAGAPGGGALDALAPRCTTLAERAQLRRWLAERDRPSR